ncbi:MAG: hypothetical protein BRC23_01515, partial [Parcubacteria group bacterium SW_4_49_11]
NEAANVITESIDEEAKVIFGTVVDESLEEGEMKVTVIATGFDQPEPIQPAKKVRAFDEAQAGGQEEEERGPTDPVEDLVERKTEERDHPPEKEEAENEAQETPNEKEEEPNSAASESDTDSSNTDTESTQAEEDYDVPAFIRNKLK